jgi:hypothetical protein
VVKETSCIVLLAYPDHKEFLLRDGTIFCMVCKSLYGLVESAWLWYKEVTATLSSSDFLVTDAYKGVVYKLAPDGLDLFASIHVD